MSPGLFDPVFIDSEANGHHFKEMHVDGGTALEVLAIPLKLAAASRLGSAQRPSGRLYIVINNNLEPAFAMTKPKTLSITARAFNTLVKSDFYDTILGSYLYAKKQGLQFNLAYIPNTFKVKSLELIDPNYMAALFEFGRTRGRAGGSWSIFRRACIGEWPGRTHTFHRLFRRYRGRKRGRFEGHPKTENQVENPLTLRTSKGYIFLAFALQVTAGSF